MLSASAIGWGFAPVGVRVAFEANVGLFTVSILRLVAATIAVAAFVGFQRRRISATAWLHGSLIGIPRVGLAPLLFMASLYYLSAGVEALFVAMMPAATAIFAWLMLREPLNWVQGVGLALGFVGVALIILSGDSGLRGGEGNIVIGGLFCLGGVLATSSSGVLGRKYAPLHVTADLAMPMFVSGTAALAVVSFVVTPVDVSELDLPMWVLLTALGLGCTLLPFIGTLYASRFVSATKVSVVGYVVPLIAIVAGIILLDEVLSTGIVVGGLLTLSGALLVLVGRRPAHPLTALRPLSL